MMLFHAKSGRWKRAPQIFVMTFVTLSVLVGVQVGALPVERSVVVSTELGGVSGQKEASDKAIEKVTIELVDELIGEAERLKQALVIERRILRQSGKYVLVIRNLHTKPKDRGFEHQVQLKISPESLEEILLKEGLLYRTEGYPRILTMVSLSDRVNGRNLNWWQDNSGEGDSSGLQDLAMRIIRSLKNEMRPRGFFVMDPLSGALKGLVPLGLRRENLSSEDVLFLARMLQAQMILRGSVLFQSLPGRSDVYRIVGRMSAIHANNGRVVAEVSRVYQTASGPFRAVVPAKLVDLEEKMMADLATQIHEVWKSGVFGAGVLNVSVRGELAPRKLEELRASVLAQVRDMKNLKERLFEPGRVVFETDTTLASEQLAERLKKVKVPGVDLRVESVNASGVELKVVAPRG